MWLLWALFIGFIVGIVARFLMPGKDPGGFIVTSLIGIAGSIVATFIGQQLGWYIYGEPSGFIASVIGAMLVLFGYRMLSRRA